MKILVTGGSGFIGTNLMEKLIQNGSYTVLNLDNAKPHLEAHLKFWKQCDLMDASQVKTIFDAFQPEAVIHMAARTDTDPHRTLEDYKINTEGSKIILDAIQATKSVQRIIMTSTQFVNQYHGVPKHDEDFAPHTVYGESKVIMEQMIRKADLKCTWTIIRPTNIWGPWHIRYPFEFWKVLSKGLYFHPGKQPVVRSYGYVGNVVHQTISILESAKEKVDKQVFYVGDEPIDIYHWVNGFSKKQIGKSVRVLPRSFVKVLAITGDMLSLVKIRFPLTSSRYKSMTNSNSAPMEKTLKAFGAPYTLEKGIEETVEWLKKYHPDLVKIK